MQLLRKKGYRDNENNNEGTVTNTMILAKLNAGPTPNGNFNETGKARCASITAFSGFQAMPLVTIIVPPRE